MVRDGSCKTFLLLVGSITLSLSPLHAQDTPRQVYEKTAPSVVTVYKQDPNGKSVGLGTAFAIDNGKLVTNHHVIQGGDISVQIGPVNIEAEVEKSDVVNDLAIIVLKAKASLPSLKLAQAAPKSGDKIFVVGNPAGLEKSISEGLVSGIRTVDGKSLIQINASISPGSSGSPVVNSAGEVVAVALGTLERGQNLNFAVPVDFLRRLLDQTAKPISSLDLETVEKLAASLSDLKGDYEAWSKKFDEVRQLSEDLADRTSVTDPAISMRLAKVLEVTNCDRASVFADRAFAGGANYEQDAAIIQLKCAAGFSFEEETKKRATVNAQELAAKNSNLTAEFHELYGELLNDQREYDLAELHLRLAMLAARTERNDLLLNSAVRNLMRSLEGENDNEKLEEAVLLFDSLPVGARTGWDYYEHAGRLKTLSNFKDAASAYDAALPLTGEKSFHWIDAGITHYFAGNLDTALTYLRKGIEINAAKNDYEKFLAAAHYCVASILETRGVLEQALTHARQATVLDPPDPTNQELVADILENLKRPSEALSFAKRALSLSDGKYASTHFTLGNIQFDLADWDEAAREYQLAATMAPTDWSAAFNAGLSLERAFRNVHAVEWYLKALSRNPPREKRYIVEQALKRVRNVPNGSTTPARLGSLPGPKPARINHSRSIAQSSSR